MEIFSFFAIKLYTVKTFFTIKLLALLVLAGSCATTEVVAESVEEVETIEEVEETSQAEAASDDTVLIGTQVWATRNLNTIVFANGDTIMQAASREEWVEASKNKIPAWCYHENENGDTYGKLYNYWAIIDERGLAPEGWRIPTADDFSILATHVQSTGSAALKSTSGWEEGGSGNNSTGFNALPGGYRNATGLCNPIGRIAAWWTTSEKSSGSAFGYVINADDNEFAKDEYYKRSGLYVRCVR